MSRVKLHEKNVIQKLWCYSLRQLTPIYFSFYRIEGGVVNQQVKFLLTREKTHFQDFGLWVIKETFSVINELTLKWYKPKNVIVNKNQMSQVTIGKYIGPPFTKSTHFSTQNHSHETTFQHHSAQSFKFIRCSCLSWKSKVRGWYYCRC